MTTEQFLIYLVMMAVAATCAEQQIGVDRNEIGSKVLSRRKRFVVFPTGSSFSVAACMTVGVYGNPQFSIFSWALNYGFAYNLPTNSSYFLHPPQDVLDFPFFHDETSTTTTTTEEPEIIPASDESNRRQYYTSPQRRFETKPMMQRRYRRDVYKNIEGVIDRMGYNGRDCMLRALCESPQIFNIKQKSMVQELIKTVFSLPKSKVLPFEHNELLIYDEAHRKGRNKIDCETSYSKCGFSLIRMALGKYSQPQNSFM